MACIGHCIRSFTTVYGAGNRRPGYTRSLIKTELTDYLPRTVKLTIPTETDASDAEVLFSLLAELLNVIDQKEKKMDGRIIDFKKTSFV